MATQKMHLLNSGHIQRKLETSPKLRSLIKARTVKNKDTSKDILEEIYLSVLSRFPTADEVKNAHAYAKSGIVKGNDVWIDIFWKGFISNMERIRDGQPTDFDKAGDALKLPQ